MCPSQCIILGGPSWCHVSLLVILTLMPWLMVSTRFLYGKFICGKKLGDSANTIFHHTSMNFTIYWGILPATIITLVFTKWFSASILPTPFINWNYTVSKSYLSLLFTYSIIYLDQYGFLSINFTVWVLIHYYHYLVAQIVPCLAIVSSFKLSPFEMLPSFFELLLPYFLAP